MSELGAAVASIVAGIVEALVRTPPSARERVAKNLLRSAEIAAKLAATDKALGKIPPARKRPSR